VKNDVDPTSTTKKLATDPSNPWLRRVEATLLENRLTQKKLLQSNPIQAKKYMNTKLSYQTRKIYKAAEEKTKIRDYICL